VALRSEGWLLEGYSLGLQKLDEAVGIVRPGTNLMVVGPPMSSKDLVVQRIIEQGLNSGEAVVLVETRMPAESILEHYTRRGTDISKLAVVDCMSRTLGISSEEAELILRATSPVDLTGIGVRISKLFEKFWRDGSKSIRLVVDSLSTILMYSNLQTVFRFLHVFTGRIKAAGALGVYTLDAGMYDEKTIATLKQLFDAMIEIKQEGDKEFVRAVGLTPSPTPWFECGIDVDEEVGISGGD